MKDDTRTLRNILHWISLFGGIVLLLVALGDYNSIDSGLPNAGQPGYQAYTIAHAALRVGAAACFLLVAIATRPRD